MRAGPVARWLSILAGMVSALFVGPASATAIVRVPPAKYAGSPVAKAAVAMRLVAESAPRRLIALAPPTSADNARLKSANAAPTRAAMPLGAGSGKGRPLTIGFGREVPALQRSLRGASLLWQPVADGGWAARIDVSSPDAAALRVALTMGPTDPGVTVRFAGSAVGSSVIGPIPAKEIAQQSAASGVYWSPVLEGGVGTIELHAPAGVARDAIALTVERVSHLVVAGADLKRIDAKRLSEIGASGTCEIDLACVVPLSQALKDAASSVAEVVYTVSDGRTGLCTGTLLNDTVTDYQPYVYTANHCVDSQAVAATINTYWFFDAVACGSLQVPPYVLLTGGAMLLGRSQDNDWSMFRLNRPPPAGVSFSAWTSDLVPDAAVGTTLHHPWGDLKKWTQGSAVGYAVNTESDMNGTFLKMIWDQGSTELGSSGAGLFTFYAPGSYYELRGGLSAGIASCSDPSGYDLFTRMDVALPLLRQYLTPDAPNPNGRVPVVEFYAQSLDHYFISTNPVEIDALDTGTIPGWVRTGLRLLAYADPASGASPVCRFYLRPGYGDSHFFSGDPAECAATAQRFGFAWIYESPNVFYIPMPNPVTGACPADTQPVWRFFNAVTTNHRYTTEKVLRDQMRADPTWIPEGYGPDAVIMCAPNG